MSQGFLVLVAPTAVVRQRLSLEQFGVVPPWLVGEEDDDLAFYINILVVVPLELWSDDPMADEDCFCFEGGVFLL